MQASEIPKALKNFPPTLFRCNSGFLFPSLGAVASDDGMREPGQVVCANEAISGQGSRGLGRCSVRASRVRDLVEMAENLVMCHFPVAMPAFDYRNVEGLRTTAGPCQRCLAGNFREQRRDLCYGPSSEAPDSQCSLSSHTPQIE